MKTRDLSEMLFLAAVWGGSFLFLRIASPALGPLGVAAWRVSGAALLLIPLVAYRGQLGGLRQHWPRLAVAALLSTVLPFLGLSQASRTLPAGLLSILNATTPMWAAVVGWIWSREPLSPLRAAGLALGFGGVALLASHGSQLNAEGAYGAVALGLTSPLMYALAVHYNKRYLPDLSPLSISAGTLAMGSMLLFLPAWWVGPQPLHVDAAQGAVVAWSDVPSSAWWAVVALAVPCTSVAYLVFYRLIDRVGPSRALTVTFLIPVFGMLWGALFLAEQVTWLMVLSAGVVLLGTWLSNQQPASAVAGMRAAARS
jgi:drug/metabolite transporter (DMT)-like permease